MQPGYYFHVQPGRSFVAGGKHYPDGPELLKLRTAIGNNTGEFLKIVEKKSFLDAFGKVRGESLKSAPKGFDPEHKAVEYLKLKEYMAFTEFLDEEFLTSAEFPRHLVKLAKEMYPLVAFLRKALA
ncbi:MAG: DUF2461 domain-containing protein [Acidobacteria bacterium]|nr:DUF2461 domain-containing protein [Acidobacteriota bacterium]